MTDDHDFSLDGLKITLPIWWEQVDDDDGCGDPSRTGNSMTGCRGSHMEAEIGIIDGAIKAKIVDAVLTYVAEQMADLEYDKDHENGYQ